MVGELRIRGAVVGWLLVYGGAQLVVALQLDVGGGDLVPGLVWGPALGLLARWVTTRGGEIGRFLAGRMTGPLLAGGLGLLAVLLLMLGWDASLDAGHVLRGASQCLCVALAVATAPSAGEGRLGSARSGDGSSAV